MSKFIVSARKYRPTTFEEVVGQAHVADTLKNALQSDKLAHSFLFCGPRGVGKTTCARILAKVINCQNPIDKTQPCNNCSSCNSFNDSASFNIIELDAASNNSVDNIRNLIDQVRIPPQQGRYKVFIIDEVHMLSTSAFNAFLKTLEEPPSYAIFILATTEKHKILPTILSRCQIFDFKRIQVQDVVLQLKDICNKEGITAEPEALHLIGQKADGAMRDALSIFDKVASSSGSTLTSKDVMLNLNILDYDYYFRVVDAFLREDLSQVLLIMDDVMKQGFDVDQFIQGLGSHMRDLLVCKDSRTLGLLDVSESLKTKYSNQAQYATKSMLLTGLDLLNQCDVALPRATNKRLYAEIALSKINFTQRTIDTHFAVGGDFTEKKTKVLNEIASLASEQPKEIVSANPADSSTDTTSKEPVPSNVKEVEDKAKVATNVEAPTFDIPSISDITNTSKMTESIAIDTDSVGSSHKVNHNSDDQIEPVTDIASTEIKIPREDTNLSVQHSYDSVASEEEEIAKSELAATPTSPTATSSGLNLSLDNMLASIEKADAELSAAKENFGIEAINEIWSTYTELNPSPSVQAALKRTFLNLDNKDNLEVTVPAAIAGEIILNESQLIEQLRTELGTPGLILKIVLKPEEFPDFEETVSTSSLKPKEKYQLLLEKKPELKMLIDKLEMRPDNDISLS